jgi:hypothetical protein
VRALVAAAVVLASTATARAQAVAPCDDAALLAPADVGIRDTGFDAPAPACARRGVYVTGRGHALVDTADFYGTLAASSWIGARWVLPGSNSDHEFELGARVVDLRFTQTAVITVTETTIGPIYAGVSLFPTRIGDDHAYRLRLRAELDYTNTAYDGLAAGALAENAFTTRISSTLAWHNRLALLAFRTSPVDGPQFRTAAAASTDLGQSLSRNWSLAYGLEAQTGWYGYGTTALDHLLARAAARVRLAGRHDLALTIAIPLAGEERTNAVVALGWLIER